MKATIIDGVVKGLTYRAGTKESDPKAIGRVVIEFDADEADAGDIAALIGSSARIDLDSPQLAMFTRVNTHTGEVG